MNKKTLIIGASQKANRYSNYAIKRLLHFNHDVVAIGARKGTVANINIEIDYLPIKDLDTVSIYLNSKKQKPFYEYIVSLNPKRVIFNPGTENQELYAILKDNNIAFEESCTLVLLSTDQY